MDSHAFFRKPGELASTETVQTSGEPMRFDSVEALNGHSGFVIAPFAVTCDCPVLLLQPDKIVKRAFPPMQGYDFAPDGNVEKRISLRDDYARDFSSLHSRIAEGKFSKIVLARQSVDVIGNPEPPRRLFERACHLYSNMFVALVSTPVSGTHVKAVPQGDTVTALARIVHSGSTLHVWNVDITDTSGQLISTASVTNYIIDKKK